MNSFEIHRTNKGKNKPKVTDITNVFRATGCIDLDSSVDPGCDISFDNLWIFNIEQLTDYYWDYDNQGLKLMHTRFYPTTSGTIGYVE